MLEIEVPGWKTLRLEHLVLDQNGTLAVDGVIVSGIKDRLKKIATDLSIHVLTADTFGQAEAQLRGIPCQVHILPMGKQDAGKLAYVESLGADRTVSIGNGRNDCLMLEKSTLGVAVILAEGAAVKTMQAADVVCVGITSALDLLLNPLRLIATLRK